jgi:hypothetical protein
MMWILVLPEELRFHCSQTDAAYKRQCAIITITAKESPAQHRRSANVQTRSLKRVISERRTKMEVEACLSTCTRPFS